MGFTWDLTIQQQRAVRQEKSTVDERATANSG